jgi:hypothetical protein
MRIAPMLLLLAGLAGVPASASTPAFTVVDLATQYAAFYDATLALDPGARVEAFKAHFGPRFPGFYAPERISQFTTLERYDAQIARSFATFADLRPRFERTARSFVAMLEPARDDFVRHFPDLAPIGEIYLIHSMGEMDGGIRTIGGRRHLVFGADVMARLHPPGEERPFFQHELFHVYHGQFFADCDAVWCALWTEGLAVYVSEQLNPGVTDAQLMLEVPRPIRPEVDAKRQEAVCAVRARLDSAERGDYAPLFMGQASLDGLPPRFAYYVGYLVAREAARTRSLRELAQLRTADARPIVDAALAALATCAPAGTAPTPAPR